MIPDLSCESPTILSPVDSRIVYSGHVRMEFVAKSGNGGLPVARFDRILDMEGKGYRWNNPGVSIRFRTDAREVTATLHFNELHISSTARNSVGRYSVDGILRPEWSFRTRSSEIPRSPETVQVVLTCGDDPGFHEYELFLPYGDSVDFGGLKVSPGARFEPAGAGPHIRYVAYGDSITQGFTAGDVGKTYPFLLGRRKGWQTINLGFGGRASTASDGSIVGSLKPDVVTVLMGGNDWQCGVPLDRYRANMEGFLAGLRHERPQIPVYLLTPLWVAPSWNPTEKTTDLENYRRALRSLMKDGKDPHLHLVEGPDLIDPEVSLFDIVAVHPNDEGFARMADRLAYALKEPEKYDDDDARDSAGQ